MSKTILIGMTNKFSANANRWLFTLSGIVFFANGVFSILSNIFEPIGLIIGVLMLFFGSYNLFYGIFEFSRNSNLASKVKIDESIIELKNSMWKPSKILKWEDLVSVKFQPYEIIFHLKDSIYSFSYNSNSDISRTVKQVIREFSERKSIEINKG